MKRFRRLNLEALESRRLLANLPPVIADYASSPTPNYVENAPAIPILAASTTVVDIDSANFSGGKLVARVSARGSIYDVLSIKNQGNGAGQIGYSGNTVKYGGVAFGVTGGGTGGAPLVVTLTSGAATPQSVQALLRAITFRNSSDAPYTALRTISFTVNDGDGGTSSAATRNLSVTAINDAPLLFETHRHLGSFAEDSSNPPAWRVSFLSELASDADANALHGIAVTSAPNGTWQYTLDAGAHWNSLGDVSASAARLLPADSTTKVRFVPNDNWSGAAHLYYRAWDQTQGSVGGTLDISGNQGGNRSLSTAYAIAFVEVTYVNDAPVVGNIGTDIDYIHDGDPVLLVPNATVSDVDDSTLYRIRVQVTKTSSPQMDTVEATRDYNVRQRLANRLAIGGGFTVDESGNVMYGSVVVGRRQGDGVGTRPLIVYFNENGTLETVQSLLRSITFQTINGGAASRLVQFEVQDRPPGGAGGARTSFTKTINVI